MYNVRGALSGPRVAASYFLTPKQAPTARQPKHPQLATPARPALHGRLHGSVVDDVTGTGGAA